MNILSWISIFVVIVFILPSMVALSILQVGMIRVRGENVERLVQREIDGSRQLEMLLSKLGQVVFTLTFAEVINVLAAFIFCLAVLYDGFNSTIFVASLLAGLLVLATFVLNRTLAYMITGSSPEQAILRLVPLATLLLKLFYPSTLLVTKLEERIKSNSNQSSEDQEPSKEGQNGEGVIYQGHEVEEHEREMIRAILRLEDTTVREIMVPFPDIVAVSEDASISEIIDLINSEGFTRIPLFESTKDNIIGVIYAKDLLTLVEPRTSSVQLKTICREPFFIPETKKLDELLDEFQQKRLHLGVVVDEYGAVSGHVTIEDLLEEIVGEIADEYDSQEPEAEIVSDDEIVIDAKAPLDMLDEYFSIEMRGDGFDTIGGLIFHDLGKIPVPGDRVTANELMFEVLTTVGRRIRKVRVWRDVELNTPDS